MTAAASPVENPPDVKDYCPMSSQRLSVDTAELQTVADGSAAQAAELDEYRRACDQWINDVEQEIERCHGKVAAPVGVSLREFYTRLNDQTELISGDHSTMNNNINAAARRYDEADSDGAQTVQTAGGWR